MPKGRRMGGKGTGVGAGVKSKLLNTGNIKNTEKTEVTRVLSMKTKEKS